MLCRLAEIMKCWSWIYFSEENPVPDRVQLQTLVPIEGGVSERLHRAFKKVGVVTSFKPHKTLHHMLVSPKDKPPLQQIPGTVYHVRCEDCDSTYIGESARPLGKRLKEHNTHRTSATSTVSEHLKST